MKMNEHERIAARNIEGAFEWIIGGYYNYIQDGCEELIPDSAEEIKEELYCSALHNMHKPGYLGSGKAPREMRFAGEKFCREYIEKLWAEDGDVEEIAEVKGWK